MASIGDPEPDTALLSPPRKLGFGLPLDTTLTGEAIQAEQPSTFSTDQIETESVAVDTSVDTADGSLLESVSVETVVV